MQKITNLSISEGWEKGSFSATFYKYDEEKKRAYEGNMLLKEEDLKGIFEKLIASKTKAEQEEEVMEKIIEEKREDPDFVKTYPKLFPDWQDGRMAEKGKIYRRLDDSLWLCEKNHEMSYDLLPHIDDGTHWKAYPEVAEKPESEYEKGMKAAKPWSRDESYDAGVYVTWYRELYKSSQRITDNAEPGKNTRWVKIPKE